MSRSKLTARQLEAAIRSSVATSNRHYNAGNMAAAKAAARRAEHNEEELRQRQDSQADGSQAAAPPAPDHIPDGIVPDDAVTAAQAIARQWGSTALVRAAVAVLNSRTSYAESMDVAELPRVIAMRRRA